MECIPEARAKANERFVSQAIQFDASHADFFLDENPDGVNLTAAVGEISKRWKLLSGEDRVAMTADSIQEIEDEREAKNLAPHNVPLWAFHDARNTIQTVEKEVCFRLMN